METQRNPPMEMKGASHLGALATESLPMRVLRRLGRDDLAWTLRRLHVPIDDHALVLEVGSGGNPFPRSNVLLDAYEVTRERHYQPLTVDRPIVLGLVEDMPFRDDTFDFVIACHVIEHSTDIGACLRELQRVARAGYIECPDAFFERINPYKDHRYEVTERDGSLVTRRKLSWIGDREVVELYERQVKPSKKWLGHLRQNPFAFHVRYYWSRDAGGIRHVDLTPAADRSARFREEPQGQPPTVTGRTIRSRLNGMARTLLSQASRNREIDLLPLLRCMSCHQSNLERSADELLCRDCGRRYAAEPTPRMFAKKEGVADGV